MYSIARLSALDNSLAARSVCSTAKPVIIGSTFHRAWSNLMSRVINPERAGKLRNQHMRTAAELLRRLGQKPEVDAEARDMVATLIYCFREIEDGIEVSMQAWEKRNYWNKVEQFRAQWSWLSAACGRLEELVRTGAWEQLPMHILPLLPHFVTITINKFTRTPETWAGAYERLMAEYAQQGGG
jgi:hypothetical protein